MKILSFFPQSFFIAFAFCALSGCKKDSSDPAPTNSGLPVLTTTTVTAITGTTAQSGGNISSDEGNAITQRGICWSTSPAPDTNRTTKTKDGSGKGAFTSQLTGLMGGTKYYVRSYAVNSKGLAYGNEISFTTMVASNPCDLSSVDRGFIGNSFSNDTILAPGTYKLFNGFNTNKKLTLMAGVVIEAQGNYEFKCSGIIKILGTATCPVLFTSKTKTPGSWFGLNINSTDTANQIDFAIVEYGGAGSNYKANVKIGEAGKVDANASFRNCIFRKSAGYGFYCTRSETLLETMENCTFSDNADAPITIHWSQAESLQANCTYTNNGKNYIELNGGYEREIVKDVTLSKQPLPFKVASDEDRVVFHPHTLTINPGVTLIVSPLCQFIFSKDAVAKFLGTAAEPITVKGTFPTAGYWGGFLFSENPNDNIIRYVNFSDGGSPYVNSAEKGMIDITQTGTSCRVTIENCSFSNSTNYGIGIEFRTGPTYPPNVINGTSGGPAIANALTGANTFTNVSPTSIKVYP